MRNTLKTIALAALVAVGTIAAPAPANAMKQASCGVPAGYTQISDTNYYVKYEDGVATGSIWINCG